MSANTQTTSVPYAKHKLVILGDQSVGKTSIITRFVYDSFETGYTATIGIDFLSKTVYLADRPIRLQMWDTAGQERFRSLIPSYIRDSSAAIITYDITNAKSFDNAERWINEVRIERGSENVVCILVGNKSDMADQRQVTIEQGEAKAKELNVMFVETSAKVGLNITELFRKICLSLICIRGEPELTTKPVVEVKLEPAEKQQRQKACGKSC